MDDNQVSGSNGGKARAQLLSPEQRTEIARRAAEKRWYSEAPEVLCAGDLKLGGVVIPCYVTVDGQRLISGRAMQEALRLVSEENPTGTEKPGSRLTRLLNNKKLKSLIYKDKSPDHFSPKRIRWQGRTINGFNGEMLADICEGMLQARSEGKLTTPRQEIIAAQCEVLLRGFARVGIAALIDEATGYQALRPVDALKMYLETILKKELSPWIKHFPDEFYENIYRLKSWPWPGMSKNRYSVVGHYTRNLIYQRLAPGLQEEFDRRNPKGQNGSRKHKNFQWFDEPGERLFAQQMFTVLALQRACLRRTSGNKWHSFLRMMDEVLPKRGTTLPMFPELAEEG